jgi:hypothetical protein
MYPFGDLAAVDEVLQELMQREKPLIALLPRQPGRKEGRYAQLFSGIPDLTAEEHGAAPEAARMRVAAENDRIAKLEAELTALRDDVAELRRMMDEFKRQFE